MGDNKVSMLVTGSKERVALDLFHHIFGRLYEEEIREKEYYIDLYKDCLMAVDTQFWD